MTVHIAYLAEEGAGSTGVRVVEPPPTSHQAQRGSFYAVVDLQGPPQATPQLTERLLSAMQRTYYAHKGTQSQVLEETIRSAQQVLEAENRVAAVPWAAGIVCIGLMQDRLAMAGLGDAFAFVTTDGGDVNVYPPDRLSPAFAPAPGTLDPWPLHRQKVGAGGAILAGGGQWLELVSPRILAGAAAYVDADSCQDAAEGLRQQVGQDDLPGLIVVFAAPGDQPHPSPPPPPAPSSGEGPSRTRQGGLPTALNATPPVTSAPAASTPLPPAATNLPSHLDEAAAAGMAAAVAGFAAATEAPPAATPPPPASPSALPVAAVAAGLKAGLGRARDLLSDMLPDGNASAPATAEMSSTAAAAELDYHDYASRAAPARPAPYVPPPRATGSRARMLVTAAVIVLLLVPAVVAAVYWQQGATNRAEAESLLDLAEARLLSAQDALDQEDKETGRAMLTEARNYVLQSEEILGRTSRSSELLAQADRELQDVLQISLLYGLGQPLTTFPADAEPQSVLVIDQDLYVLDAGRGEIVKYRLDAEGETLAEAEGQSILRSGDVINGVTVASILDLAWQMPIPGYVDKANLLVLDANNRVFRYNPVDGTSLLSFGDPANWTRVNQVEVYLDRLYASDDSANQIYRYSPGQYQEVPAPWFQPTTQVNLLGSKVMRIDGDIWLLYNDGKVLRYRAGEQVPFSLDESVALPEDPVDMYVSQQGDTALYLADGAEERVLYFDKDTGQYLGQFRAAEGRPLRGLRSLYIDESRGTIFLLTDEALYQQRLPR